MLTIADVLIEFPRDGGAWPLAEPAEDQAALAAELLDSAVAAAREEALCEAQATAAEQLEAVRARAVVEQDEAVAAARAAWAAAEGPPFVARLAEGFAALERTLADTLAAVMRPVVEAALVDRVKAEIMDGVRALLSGSEGGLITIRGPDDLLAAARETFADQPAVVFAAAETPDVTIETGDTALASRLENWRARLDQALEASR